MKVTVAPATGAAGAKVNAAVGATLDGGGGAGPAVRSAIALRMNALRRGSSDEVQPLRAPSRPQDSCIDPPLNTRAPEGAV